MSRKRPVILAWLLMFLALQPAAALQWRSSDLFDDNDSFGLGLVVAGAAIAAGLLLVRVPDFDVTIDGDAVEAGTVDAQVRELEDGLFVQRSGFFGGHRAGRLVEMDASALHLSGVDGDRTVDRGRVKSVHDLASAAERFRLLRRRSLIVGTGGAVGLYLMAKDNPDGNTRTLNLATAALIGGAGVYYAIRPSLAERELNSRKAQLSVAPSVRRLDHDRWGLGLNARLVF